jgi:hypothetical protein
MGAFDDLIPGNSQAKPRGAFDDLIPAGSQTMVDDGGSLDIPRARPVGAAMAVQGPRLEPGPPTSTMPNITARPWYDVLREGAGNFMPSVAKAGMDTAAALTFKLPETATGIYELVKGAASKVAPGPTNYVKNQQGLGLRMFEPRPETAQETGQRSRDEMVIDALAKHYVNKYGSLEGFQHAVATDPASILMDAATVASPVKGGSAVDPLMNTGRVAGAFGKYIAEPAASTALGMTTGAEKASIRTAGRAGREGGTAAETFTANMRGDVPVTDVVDTARQAVAQMRQERSAAYKAGQVELGKDAAVLDFGEIENAIDRASAVAKFKGRSGTAPAVTTEPAAAEVVGKMEGLVQAWKALDPAEYHTPVGIDALKRTLGNIRDSTAPNTPERVAADRIYNAVRQEIASKAPGYSKMMEDYSRASSQIDEATRTFSLGERATGDTAARKLLSATRNNVQTNYGERTRLLDALAAYEPDLPYAVAGQAFNSLAPRGLVARGGGMAAAGSVMTNPVNALLLPAFSPRIVGELVYFGGKALGKVEDVAAKLGVTPERLRALELGGYQGSQVQENYSRAKALRETNLLQVP